MAEVDEAHADPIGKHLSDSISSYASRLVQFLLFQNPLHRFNKLSAPIHQLRRLLQQRLEMFVNGRHFISNCDQHVGSNNESSVIGHYHLLHLPLYSLRIDPKKLRFLVKAIEGEREKLGDVGLLGSGGQREEACHRG
ncbi:hypothetical protein TB2_015079 [Malus domestica]